jgi:hypothetical protein
MYCTGLEFPILWGDKCPKIVINEEVLVSDNVDLIQFDLYVGDTGLQGFKMSQLKFLCMKKDSDKSLQ